MQNRKRETFKSKKANRLLQLLEINDPGELNMSLHTEYPITFTQPKPISITTINPESKPSVSNENL